MSGEEATVAVIDALESAGVAYMLAGSLSSNLYGIPRSTQDADIVVQLGDASIQDIAENLGPSFTLDRQMSFEMVTATNRYQIHVHENNFKIELFLLSNDPHDQSRFARRRSASVLGRTAFVPTPEDVVIQKLRWFSDARRSKDREDLLNVIAVQRDRLDWDYIYPWCDQHGTRLLLDELRASLGPI